MESHDGFSYALFEGVETEKSVDEDAEYSVEGTLVDVFERKGALDGSGWLGDMLRH
jgi:hypothetical protein